MHKSGVLRLVAVFGVVACGALLLSRHSSAASEPKPLSSFDPQVKALLARMTLDEKIGQMTQPDQEALKDPADIEKYFLGSLLSGGSSDPKDGNSLVAWTNLYDNYQKHTSLTRLKIPILYGVDAVHGHNNVLGAVIFPHDIPRGRSNSLLWRLRPSSFCGQRMSWSPAALLKFSVPGAARTISFATSC